LRPRTKLQAPSQAGRAREEVDRAEPVQDEPVQEEVDQETPDALQEYTVWTFHLQACGWNIIAALARGREPFEAAADAAILRVLDVLSEWLILVDGQLLQGREATLCLVLTAVRADRERFQGLYQALREEPLLATRGKISEVISDFPDILPVDERLLVFWREPAVRKMTY
jgi:hypothetical protein